MERRSLSCIQCGGCSHLQWRCAVYAFAGLAGAAAASDIRCGGVRRASVVSVAGNVGRRTVHVLVGPTASGKSAVAQRIAEQTGAVILSADSMLIYRGMDIGTAKPSFAERSRVRYLGVDLADPHDAFNVWQYRQ
ncbi:MAG TPA: hypothetical protein DCS43_12045, partial [Verrucomicrobia bacterium]|nr:hypothetical protein [Verrucomicrobiota bacterium]